MISFKRAPTPGGLNSEAPTTIKNARPSLEQHSQGKCYLCERKLQSNWHIEHFRPKGRFPDLAASWQNLFACDPHCNNVKSDQWPEGGFLDPTKDDISEHLLQFASFGDSRVKLQVHFQSNGPHPPHARNTASLLCKIHEKAELLEDIASSLRQLEHRVTDYLKACRYDAELAPQRRWVLERSLSHSEPFCALRRSWLHRRHKPIFDELNLEPLHTPG